MGLLEKCSRFTRAREVQASGFYPYFIPIEASYDTVTAAEVARIRQALIDAGLLDKNAARDAA